MPVSHPVLARIQAADRLIMTEAFDTLMDHYTDDAVLIVKPGVEVRGREAIRGAMEKIALFFAHGLKVTQQQMQVLEAGETALVLARTLISAPGSAMNCGTPPISIGARRTASGAAARP